MKREIKPIKGKKALLALEDGSVFEGSGFGQGGEVYGEVVFYTGVVGYQEILTDPSYKDKIVVMTYPLIGNYGVNSRDNESGSVHAKALIIKDLSSIYSNWTAEGSLDDFMKKRNVPGLRGIDTRALTTHIRDNGEMWGCISVKAADKKSIIKNISVKKGENGGPCLPSVSVKKPRKVEAGPGKKAALLDLGAAESFVKLISESGYSVEIMPYDTKAREIILSDPDVLILSSGPEKISELRCVSEEMKKAVGKIPIVGVGAGAITLALAMGLSVKKMKVGHHGVNQPVREVKGGKCEITSQCHSFVVDEEKLPNGTIISHVNINDRSVEGFSSERSKAIGVHFVPTHTFEVERLMRHAQAE